VLDIAILGLLMERDHHGYEIRSQLRDRLGLWASVSFGSIYPALARLERAGLVEAQSLEPRLKAVTSTGSLSGERASLRSLRETSGLGRRGRKTYAITERGRAQFQALLADPTTVDDAKTFSLRMTLAKYLTPAARHAIIERRRRDLEARLAEVRRQADDLALDDYARDVLRHAARAVELDLEWINDLLSAKAPTEHVAHRAN
jgi:DNA-binding PadR family transcriptional regulator